MKKSFFVAGIVALAMLLVLGYWWLAPSGSRVATTAASTQPAAAQTAAQTTAATPTPPQTTTLPQDGDSRAASGNTYANLPAGVKSASNAPEPAAAVKSAYPNPALTRVLEPAPTFQIEDRKWAVLGTRDVPQGNTQQTVLVLRDEASGQLDYRQSALRFVLQPGTDYEAFIRERRNAQRVFVNALYGDVSLDPAYIAAEYTALANDKRVVKVQFIPLTMPAKAR